MQNLGGLRGDRLDHARMRMAKRVHRHARGEIEVAFAVGGNKPSALAPLEGKVNPRIGWQQMRCHGGPAHPIPNNMPK